MQKSLLNVSSLLFGFIFLVSCSTKKQADTLFQLTSGDDTGVKFSNTITESDSFNIFTYEYIYNGGGVGVADFNNDGLQDIFFSGNQVPNTLYLNQGDFKFKDITQTANINIPGKWNSGVAVVDINGDGLMDIYVCSTTYADPSKRHNMLFVNQGLNEAKEPTFKEMAADYKIDFNGHSVMAAFFDYDRDNDLDLYVLVNEKIDNRPVHYRNKIADGSSPNNDKLYRNEGNGTFTDVTIPAGIVHEGFGLGLAIADMNSDGWLDIYVSNDFLSNDILYLNQRNGTFSNKTNQFIAHQSQFSMGNDAADINNDARPDLITLDMLPETSLRKKTTIGGKSYLTYVNNETYHYEYQYVRNMVQVNNGLDQNIKFSEVGQLAGVFQTEWSWSPLFADFDNDGQKDLFITNGFPKDITDKDFANYRADVGNVASTRTLVDSIPIVRIPNYAFKNNGDLQFTDVTKTWGLDQPSFSNGAAFADLDNDGDLDYVVNNINGEAFLYKNGLYPAKDEKTKTANYLRVKLEGPGLNKAGLGAKITVHTGAGHIQFYEQSVYRGFLSSVEAFAHFGLGDHTTVDSVEVVWPDGAYQVETNVKANQVLTIAYKAGQTKPAPSGQPAPRLFTPADKAYTIAFVHEEEDQIDFNLQRTLPHKFSQAGPGLSVGDINNDGLEDLIIGGSRHFGAAVFRQQANGSFVRDKKDAIAKEMYQEDEGLLLFDADGDGDLDLYCVSGSLELPDSAAYQDRFYVNNGKGAFTEKADALPKTYGSGSCVRAADYDADGDLDLFVAGRVVPARYPMPAQSYLLRNDGGKFTDVTKQLSADLQFPGMVSDALWSDFNNDGKVDLVLAGEFMPVVFFQNNGTSFSKLATSGVETHSGWWNSISPGDFDKDGDIDYVVGNLGLNNPYQVTKDTPLKVFAKDFDGNGSVDPVLACYMRESMTSDVKKLFPVHFWEEINSQSPKFRNKFSRYKHYGSATLEQLLPPDDMKDALVLEANDMATSFIRNEGNGKFSIQALPWTVQLAPVNGMTTQDVNGDGNLDVVVVGNDYGNEVFSGRYDALTGVVLLGDGHGGFTSLSSAKSGLYVPRDAKALATLYRGKAEPLVVASQNRDTLAVFVNKPVEPGTIFTAEPMDSWAEFATANGQKQRVEFYYGSGYLSQSSRRVRVPKGVTSITVYDYKGKSRKVEPGI